MSDPKPAIGWDWPLVRICKHGKEQIYARDPKGKLHRLTDQMVQDQAIALIKKIGPHS